MGRLAKIVNFVRVIRDLRLLVPDFPAAELTKNINLRKNELGNTVRSWNTTGQEKSEVVINAPPHHGTVVWFEICHLMQLMLHPGGRCNHTLMLKCSSQSHEKQHTRKSTRTHTQWW